MEQFQQDHLVQKLPQFLDDAKVQGRLYQAFFKKITIENIKSYFSVKEIISSFSPDERLEGLSPDERLEGLSPDDVVSRYSPDEWLKRLSPDEIQAYLQKIQQTTDD